VATHGFDFCWINRRSNERIKNDISFPTFVGSMDIQALPKVSSSSNTGELELED
jgi:hypothetical protein